jgi:hypothetical protein
LAARCLIITFSILSLVPSHPTFGNVIKICKRKKKEKEKCFQPFQLLNRFRVRVLTLNTLRVDLFDLKSVSWILTARAAAAAP